MILSQSIINISMLKTEKTSRGSGDEEPLLRLKLIHEEGTAKGACRRSSGGGSSDG